MIESVYDVWVILEFDCDCKLMSVIVSEKIDSKWGSVNEFFVKGVFEVLFERCAFV